MKTTLKNIFDRTLPCELEKLINTGITAETGIQGETAENIKTKVYKMTALSAPAVGIGNAKTAEKAGNAEKAAVERAKKPFWRRRSLAVMAACIALTVGILLSVPAIIRFSGGSKPSPDDNTIGEIPVDENQVIWGVGGSNEQVSEEDGLAEWNGWAMTYSLYDALMRAGDEDYLAITVRTAGANEESGLYGLVQKIKKAEAEQEKAEKRREKLLQFVKEGNELKYGELLYTTGTPGGERWAKELYDSRIEYYGRDLIDRYIVDGEFLFGLLNDDLVECENRIGELSNELVELRESYGKAFTDKVKDAFSDAGVYVTVRKSRPVLIIRKDKLAELKIKNKSDYILGQASRALFYGGDDIADNDAVEENAVAEDVNH